MQKENISQKAHVHMALIFSLTSEEKRSTERMGMGRRTLKGYSRAQTVTQHQVLVPNHQGLVKHFVAS